MTKKSRIIGLSFCLILSILAGSLLCSCGGPNFSKKSVSLRTSGDVLSLDPQLAQSDAEFTVVSNCFEGLTALDESGKTVPAAAENIDVSSDGCVYTFTLRKNMLWSDGKTPVTADDFAFGLTRALLPETRAPFASLLLSIKNAAAVHSGKSPASRLGIRAVDEATLVITLERPDRNFLQTLSAPVSLPCPRAFFESTNGKYGLDDEAVLSNGAFYLREWNTEDQLISMRRFDEYNGTAAVPFGASVGYAREQSDIYAALLDNAVDIGMLSADLASRLDSNTAKESFYNKSYVLLISPKVSQTMRTALVRDINLDALRLNLPDYYLRVDSLLPASSAEGGALYSKAAGALTLKGYDPAIAKSYISEARADTIGNVDYSGYTLRYPDSSEDAKRLGALIVQQWQKELGAKINSAAYSDSTESILKKLRSGEIKSAIVPITSFAGTAADAAESLRALGISGYNKLLPNTAADEEQSIAALKKAEQYLVDKFYAVPLYCEPTVWCAGGHIGKAVFSSSGNTVILRYVENSGD